MFKFAFILSAFLILHNLNASEDQQAPAVILGKKVYDKACAACHGILGNGQGPAAKYMDPKPRDFTLGTYKFRSTPSGEPPTFEDIKYTIKKGLGGTRMPGYEGLLTEKEIDHVVAYLQSLSPDFTKSGEGNPINLPEPIPFSEDLLTEGKHLYMMMECYSCHGAKGLGDGTSAVGMKDDSGRPINPMNFRNGPYRAGEDVKTIYKTINTGVSGTPMPAFADVFLFGGGDMDVTSYAEEFSEEWTQSLKAYFSSQPSDEDIEKMSDEEKQKLNERRKWAIAYYIHSLYQKPGIFKKWFTANTDDTH